jgi:hypothetical protein
MHLNQVPCALVLENDAVLSSSFTTRLRSVQLPTQFDVIKLEGCNKPQPHGAKSVPKVTSGQGGWCSAAYLVSLEGAQLLRKLQTPIWLAADGAFRFADISYNRNKNLGGVLARNGARFIRVFHVVPLLAWQHAEFGHGEMGKHTMRPNGSEVVNT